MRRPSSTTLTLIALLAMLTFSHAIATPADFIEPGQVRSGSLLIRMQAGYRVATSLNTDVNMVINGLVARVTVTQTFENSGSDWAEGVYVFPLPDRAAVDRMRLRIGERLIEGEIREKAQARKAYETAKSAGRKTSLVEQQRPNMFTTSVANIAPGEHVTVEIEYLEDLVYDNGRFSLRFPLTITPRYMPGAPLPDRRGSGWSADTTRVGDASLVSPPMVSSSKTHRVAIRIDLDAGLPLESIVSRYHAVNVVETAGRYTVELASRSVRMDHDFELEWTPVSGNEPQALSFVETIGGESHLLLVLMPPSIESQAARRMPREMIFVIDTSGSMHGSSINQAKAALERALARLRGEDRFNVIAFSGSPRPLFDRSVAAEPRRLARAQQFVSGLSANGGTEMHPALMLALEAPLAETHLRQIVFITDGAVGNEDELYRLIDRRLGAARLFTVGIGSAPNGWFMRKAAEAGRGSYTMISALSEVGAEMDALFDKIEQPRVTGIAVDWPGGVIVDAYPEIVPDLYAGEPVVLKAKFTGAPRATDVIAIRGDTPAGAWRRELPVMQGEESLGVAALWARARLESLDDQRMRGRDTEEVRAGIIATALRYHLVSRHTSLVAVDRTPVRKPGEPMQRAQVPNLMAYGQSTEAIFGFPVTATGAARAQLIGATCLLLSVCLVVFRRPRRTGARAAVR